MSRISLAWSVEIWRESASEDELTRLRGESLCLSCVRVWVVSGKISLGIGKSPCSNGTRRGWIRELEFGFGVGSGSGFGSVVDVGSVVMVFQRERERLVICVLEISEKSLMVVF